MDVLEVVSWWVWKERNYQLKKNSYTSKEQKLRQVIATTTASFIDKKVTKKEKMIKEEEAFLHWEAYVMLEQL